jgi:hypothetical protein
MYLRLDRAYSESARSPDLREPTMAALHDTPAAAPKDVACYCCGRPIGASNIVRFDRHPRDGVCIGCAAWLHKRSLANVHEIRPPFWWRLTRGRFHRD